MHYVTDAKYVEGYKLQLVFNDHTQGIVDLADTLRNDHRSIFKELVDQNKFRQFRLDADTVVWSSGLDLSPEYLYQKLVATKH